MSSLWTPDGEHRVERDGRGAGSEAQPSGPGSGAESSGAGSRVATSETAGAGTRGSGGVRDEVAELERQLANAPAEDVIANHCYGMFQLAALHLAQSPPALDSARLAIDALAAVVEGLGDRLGETATPLRDGLAQIRLAFVQISAAQDAPAGHGDGTRS